MSALNLVIVINIIVYLIDLVYGLQTIFALPSLMTWDVVTQQPWRLITYGFMHAPPGVALGIWHILINMYMLWLFGRSVELVYGFKKFLFMYIVVVIVSGLGWVLTEHDQRLLVGASGGVSGVIMLFTINFPNCKCFVVLIPAWLLCTIIFGLDVAGILGLRSPNSLAYAGHLSGAIAGILFACTLTKANTVVCLNKGEHHD